MKKIFFAFMMAHSMGLFSQTVPLSAKDISAILDQHNYWRRDVGVSEKLVWSEDMAMLAADWAVQLKENGCAFEHRPDNNYGENLFMGTSGFFTAAEVVNRWGSEKEDYSYKRNKCKPGKMCGHYTQIVWRSTRSVGCAKTQCKDMDLWVCNYDPPGNWVGERPF